MMMGLSTSSTRNNPSTSTPKIPVLATDDDDSFSKTIMTTIIRVLDDKVSNTETGRFSELHVKPLVKDVMEEIEPLISNQPLGMIEWLEANCADYLAMIIDTDHYDIHCNVNLSIKQTKKIHDHIAEYSTKDRTVRVNNLRRQRAARCILAAALYHSYHNEEESLATIKSMLLESPSTTISTTTTTTTPTTGATIKRMPKSSSRYALDVIDKSSVEYIRRKNERFLVSNNSSFAATATAAAAAAAGTTATAAVTIPSPFTQTLSSKEYVERREQLLDMIATSTNELDASQSKISSSHDQEIIHHTVSLLSQVTPALEPMKLAVVGCVSAGKSTFLCDILGCPDLLQSSRGSTTAILTEMQYKPTKGYKAFIHFMTHDELATDKKYYHYCIGERSSSSSTTTTTTTTTTTMTDSSENASTEVVIVEEENDEKFEDIKKRLMILYEYETDASRQVTIHFDRPRAEVMAMVGRTPIVLESDSLSELGSMIQSQSVFTVMTTPSSSVSTATPSASSSSVFLQDKTSGAASTKASTNTSCWDDDDGYDDDEGYFGLPYAPADSVLSVEQDNPTVKCVRIEGPFEHLPAGIILIDTPGLGDSNIMRSYRTLHLLSTVDVVWYACPADTQLTGTWHQNLLLKVKELGNCLRQFHIIATKVDENRNEDELMMFRNQLLTAYCNASNLKSPDSQLNNTELIQHMYSKEPDLYQSLLLQVDKTRIDFMSLHGKSQFPNDVKKWRSFLLSYGEEKSEDLMKQWYMVQSIAVKYEPSTRGGAGGGGSNGGGCGNTSSEEIGIENHGSMIRKMQRKYDKAVKQLKEGIDIALAEKSENLRNLIQSIVDQWTHYPATWVTKRAIMQPTRAGKFISTRRRATTTTTTRRRATCVGGSRRSSSAKREAIAYDLNEDIAIHWKEVIAIPWAQFLKEMKSIQGSLCSISGTGTSTTTPSTKCSSSSTRSGRSGSIASNFHQKIEEYGKSIFEVDVKELIQELLVKANVYQEQRKTFPTPEELSDLLSKQLRNNIDRVIASRFNAQWTSTSQAISKRSVAATPIVVDVFRRLNSRLRSLLYGQGDGNGTSSACDHGITAIPSSSSSVLYPSASSKSRHLAATDNDEELPHSKRVRVELVSPRNITFDVNL